MRLLKAFFIALIMVPFMAFSISESEVEEVMKRCVDEGHTQGMVIGIIEEEGTRFYKYGKMGVDNDTPIDENTVFETGSITKIFTTLLLTRMVEEGYLNLDDPIQKFFPDHVKIPTYNGVEITLEHLATHTAGFKYMPDNFIMKDMYNPFVDYTVELLYVFLNEYELSYEPGTQYYYSNVCIGLLAYILSEVSGLDFDTIVYEKLLKPLDMQHTKVRLTPEMEKNYATAHIRDKKVSHWEVKSFYGAGGLRASVKDLARFVEGHLGFHHSEIDDLLAKATESRAHQDDPYLDVGHEWNISFKYQPEIIYHGGATGGHQLFLGFCPTTKKGIVVCSNSCSHIYDIGKAFLNDNWYLKKYRQQSIIPPMMLPKFYGTYEDVNSGSKCKIDIASRGHLSTLLLKWGFYPKVPLFPKTEVDFFMKVRDCQVHFESNEDNIDIVEGMTIIFEGKTYNFKKIK